MEDVLANTLAAYSKMRDACWLVITEAKKKKPRLSNFAHAHLYYYTERCQSITLLLQQDRLWDCEIIMRSALECITRLLFVCIADDEEQLCRIQEFEHDLLKINLISVSEKAARSASKSHGNPVSEALVGGAKLPEDDLKELKAIFPKRRRQELNQKWSFSEMAREISEFENDKVNLKNFPSLLHSYGISSHLIHADQLAMTLTWDRNHRRRDEKKVLIEAHRSGLMGSQNSLLFIALKALAATVDVSIDYAEIEADLRDLMRIDAEYQRRLYDTQRDLYAK